MKKAQIGNVTELLKTADARSTKMAGTVYTVTTPEEDAQFYK